MVGYYGGSARDPGGKIGSDRSKTNSGKSSGAGTNAMTGGYFGGAARDPGGQLASRNSPPAGKPTAAGDSDQAPTFTRMPAQLRPPATRPGLTDGTIAGYGPDSPASPGQMLTSALTALGITNPAMMLGGMLTEDNFSRTLPGQRLDKSLGSIPGTPVATRNPIADNTNRRGDDSRMSDRLFKSSLAELTGGVPDQGVGDTDYSTVQMADRRKPRSFGAGTNMLLGLA